MTRIHVSYGERANARSPTRGTLNESLRTCDSTGHDGQPGNAEHCPRQRRPRLGSRPWQIRNVTRLWPWLCHPTGMASWAQGRLAWLRLPARPMEEGPLLIPSQRFSRRATRLPRSVDAGQHFELVERRRRRQGPFQRRGACAPGIVADLLLACKRQGHGDEEHDNACA